MFTTIFAVITLALSAGTAVTGPYKTLPPEPTRCSLDNFKTAGPNADDPFVTTLDDTYTSESSPFDNFLENWRVSTGYIYRNFSGWEDVGYHSGFSLHVDNAGEEGWGLDVGIAYTEGEERNSLHVNRSYWLSESRALSASIGGLYRHSLSENWRVSVGAGVEATWGYNRVYLTYTDRRFDHHFDTHSIYARGNIEYMPTENVGLSLSIQGSPMETDERGNGTDWGSQGTAVTLAVTISR